MVVYIRRNQSKSTYRCERDINHRLRAMVHAGGRVVSVLAFYSHGQSSEAYNSWGTAENSHRWGEGSLYGWSTIQQDWN